MFSPFYFFTFLFVPTATQRGTSANPCPSEATRRRVGLAGACGGQAAPERFTIYIAVQSTDAKWEFLPGGFFYRLRELQLFECYLLSFFSFFLS
jgi:hypothetical protein